LILVNDTVFYLDLNRRSFPFAPFAGLAGRVMLGEQGGRPLSQEGGCDPDEEDEEQEAGAEEGGLVVG
jgi:hypothetical protein